MNYILVFQSVCSSDLTKRFLTSYHIESNMLSSQSEHSDLGIQMPMDLSWSTHYSIICSKAYKCLRRKFGKFGSVEARRSLYLALVHSQLSYCSQLWNPHLIKDTTTLERVQRHTTKYTLDHYSSDYKQRLLNFQLR